MTLSQPRVSVVRRSLLLAPLAWILPAHAEPIPPPGLLGYGGRLLAALIRAGREDAIAAGVKPVPPAAHRALLGFFPDAALRKARYASGQFPNISVPGLALAYGDIAAVTLGEVVLFRKEETAQYDHELWAHELTHVMQYERWGIDEFARRYLENRDAVENEARANAKRYKRWRERV